MYFSFLEDEVWEGRKEGWTMGFFISGFLYLLREPLPSSGQSRRECCQPGGSAWAGLGREGRLPATS